ncbi:MAG: hypothetical protein MZW92_75425 [Comamonadaceae bacterium]|nr:hypothetical protein [Comamonadaceae bacterium]
MLELYEEFINAKIYKKDFDSHNFLKNKAGSPFISYDPADLESDTLLSFWWDIHHWLGNAHVSPEELLLKIGSLLF